MSKKQTQKNVQLSPENYIRKVARKLPIYKCTINSDWEKGRLASILIARQHANGNITSCFYMVDIACLGVKDTMYRFNENVYEFEDFQLQMNARLESMEVPYNLVHNIIYAALEFAAEYAFNPHKDFTSVTNYFLEEDTEDIPLIEIACGGKDGNPWYINNGYESPTRARQIVNQLEKTAGTGNFTYMDNVSGLEYEAVDDDDEEDEDLYGISEYENIFQEYKDSDFKTIFNDFDELAKKIGMPDFDPQMLTRLRVITDIIAEGSNLIDSDTINKYCREFVSDLDIDFCETDDLPNSLFGDIKVPDPERFVDEYFEILDEFITEDNCESKIIAFEENYGYSPAAEYLRLLKLMYEEKDKKARKLLDTLLKEYPNYFLFNLLNIESNINTSKKHIDAKKELQNLLSETADKLTDYEKSKYIEVYGGYVSGCFDDDADLNRLFAMELFIENSGSNYDNISFLTMVRMAKIIKIIMATSKKVEG